MYTMWPWNKSQQCMCSICGETGSTWADLEGNGIKFTNYILHQIFYTWILEYNKSKIKKLILHFSQQLRIIWKSFMLRVQRNLMRSINHVWDLLPIYHPTHAMPTSEPDWSSFLKSCHWKGIGHKWQSLNLGYKDEFHCKYKKCIDPRGPIAPPCIWIWMWLS